MKSSYSFVILVTQIKMATLAEKGWIIGHL